MASARWSSPTVCWVLTNSPTESVGSSVVRITSISPFPRRSPDHALVHQDRALEDHFAARLFHHPEPGARVRQHLFGEPVDPTRGAPHVDLLEHVLAFRDTGGDRCLDQHPVLRAAVRRFSPNHRRHILSQDDVVLRISLVDEAGEGVVEVRSIVLDMQLHAHHVPWYVLALFAQPLLLSQVSLTYPQAAVWGVAAPRLPLASIRSASRCSCLTLSRETPISSLSSARVAGSLSSSP